MTLDGKRGDAKSETPEEEFDFVSLLGVVQTRYGPEVAKWLDEAAYVSQWWISENHRRWKYDADSEMKS